MTFGANVVTDGNELLILNKNIKKRKFKKYKKRIFSMTLVLFINLKLTVK